MTNQEFKIGDCIRHYKGNDYKIIAEVNPLEDLLENESLWVELEDGTTVVATAASEIDEGEDCFVYESLNTGIGGNPPPSVWVRPIRQFSEMVTEPRFEALVLKEAIADA